MLNHTRRPGPTRLSPRLTALKLTSTLIHPTVRCSSCARPALDGLSGSLGGGVRCLACAIIADLGLEAPAPGGEPVRDARAPLGAWIKPLGSRRLSGQPR
ncbi:MAG TPA: hypothetical protein VI138_02865 [Candidatus Dormibacteraeota bacterium]